MKPRKIEKRTNFMKKKTSDKMSYELDVFETAQIYESQAEEQVKAILVLVEKGNDDIAQVLFERNHLTKASKEA